MLGCSDALCDHDAECNVIGGPQCKFTLAIDVTYVLCTNLPGTNMFPCALARLKPEAVPKKAKSQSDALLHALRNAKELAAEMGSSASTGWPMWWLEDVVLEYSAWPDGVSV